jgi:hypothetical protein
MVFTVGLPALPLTAAAASSHWLDALQAEGSRVLTITVPQRIGAVQFKEYMRAIDKTRTGIGKAAGESLFHPHRKLGHLNFASDAELSKDVVDARRWES